LFNPSFPEEQDVWRSYFHKLGKKIKSAPHPKPRYAISIQHLKKKKKKKKKGKKTYSSRKESKKYT
jgi:hypothetical protein